MRKSRLSAEESNQLDEINRQETRKTGFSLMEIRDRGHATLSNGSVLHWHVNRPLKEGEARQTVPDGDLLIDGKPFDAEELMKVIRWA